MTTSSHDHLALALAQTPDHVALRRLWTMFRHEMSAFSGALPDAHGRFREERLDAALADPSRQAFILRLGPSAVGLALVRGLDAEERVLGSFFLVHGARRAGHGRAAVRAITARHPGRWAVAFQDANLPAAAFWPAVAAAADSDWSLERRPVPGRPDLPPDSWVRFRVS